MLLLPKNPSCPWRILLAACLLIFLVNIDYTALNLALLNISQNLQSSIDTMQWIISGYLLGWGLAVVPAGILADHFGHRNFCLLGIGIFLLASILCSLSNSASFLIVWRIAQGIGGALFVPTLYSLIISNFPQRHFALALGFFGSAAGVGLAIGPSLCGWILQFLDWRWIFLINIPCCLIAARLIFKHANKDPAPSKHVRQFKLLFNRNYIVSTFCFSLQQYCFTACLLLLGFYIQISLQLSVYQAGLILLFMTVAFSIASPLAAKISQFIGQKNLVLLGFALLLVSVYGLYNTQQVYNVIWFDMLLVLVGLSLGFTFSVLNASMAASLEASIVGLGASIFTLLALLGNMLSVYININYLKFQFSDHLEDFSLLTQGGKVSSSLITDFIHSLGNNFILTMAMILLALLLALKLKPENSSKAQKN